MSEDPTTAFTERRQPPSRDEMRQARQDLNNAKVTITGRTEPWSGAAGGRIEHAGSVIRNDCGGGFVILADDIRPAN